MSDQPPQIKLDRGIHVMHLFYRVDRAVWARLRPGEGDKARAALETFFASHAAASHPRATRYANVNGKADFAFFLLAAELDRVSRMHRELEACFPPGTLIRVFSYLSVTELTEYMPTEEDNRRILLEQERLEAGSAAFNKRMEELSERIKHYEHYRLYPELPEWEVMAFYPMTKRRAGPDNWYFLDFATRKRLMGGHARVGRKYSGRVSQLITGSAGLDDWEWGVTLMAHQVDAIKEIVYEMRFDEVTARFGEFGPFFVNMRLAPGALWKHLLL